MKLTVASISRLDSGDLFRLRSSVDDMTIADLMAALQELLTAQK